MTEDKRKAGRPRKWSSDAERMRSARAVKREMQLAEEERRAERTKEREEARRTVESAAVELGSLRFGPTDRVGGRDPAVGHSECRATLRKLQMIIDKMNDRYSDLAMDRWMLKVRYDRAISRMEKHDPEGPVWLDNRLREWEKENNKRRREWSRARSGKTAPTRRGANHRHDRGQRRP